MCSSDCLLYRQVACADVILLNKVDLVTNAKVTSVEELIRKVNPAAPIHRTVQGQVDLSLVMDIKAFASAPSFHKPTFGLFHEHGDGEDPHHTHNTHYESRGISSLQVTCPALSPSHMEKLDEWIRTVLWENHLPGADVGGEEELRVLRCKGLFTTQSGEQYVLQGVQNLYEISRADVGDVAGVPEAGKLVLIGKGLTLSVRRSLEDVFN